tara:strand:- start:45 stop:653 length:609 start_codon:yes stop_codon:yes gene_type:complete
MKNYFICLLCLLSLGVIFSGCEKDDPIIKKQNDLLGNWKLSSITHTLNIDYDGDLIEDEEIESTQDYPIGNDYYYYDDEYPAWETMRAYWSFTESQINIVYYYFDNNNQIVESLDADYSDGWNYSLEGDMIMADVDYELDPLIINQLTANNLQLKIESSDTGIATFSINNVELNAVESVDVEYVSNSIYIYNFVKISELPAQ